MLPIPFTIATVLFLVAFLISKLQYSSTYTLVALFSVLGLMETGSLIVALLSYFQVQGQSAVIKILLIACLTLIFMLNFLGYMLQTPYMLVDRKVQRWMNRREKKQDIRVHLVWFHIISIFTFLTNYKFKMILFSRLFSIESLKCQMENVGKLKIFDILSFIGVVPEAIAIYCCIVVFINFKDSGIILIFLDTILILTFNVIATLFSTNKGNDFFLDTIDGIPMNQVFNVGEDSFQSAIEIRDQTNKKQTNHLLSDIFEGDQFAYTTTKRQQHLRNKTRMVSKQYQQKLSEENTGSKSNSWRQQSLNEINEINVNNVSSQQNNENIEEINQIIDQSNDSNIFDQRQQDLKVEEMRASQPLSFPNDIKTNKQEIILENLEPGSPFLQQFYAKDLPLASHIKLSDYLLSQDEINNQQYLPPSAQRSSRKKTEFVRIEQQIQSQKSQKQQKFRLLINESALIGSQPSQRLQIQISHPNCFHQQKDTKQESEAKRSFLKTVNKHRSPKKFIQKQSDIIRQKSPLKIQNTAKQYSMNEEHDEKPIKNKSIQKIKRMENHPVNQIPTSHPIYGQKAVKCSNSESQGNQDQNYNSEIRPVFTSFQPLTYKMTKFQEISDDIQSTNRNNIEKQPIKNQKYYEDYIKNSTEEYDKQFKRSVPQSMTMFPSNKFEIDNHIHKQDSYNYPRRPIHTTMPTQTANEKCEESESKFILKRKTGKQMKYLASENRPRTTSQNKKRVLSHEKKLNSSLKKNKSSLEKIYLQKLVPV